MRYAVVAILAILIFAIACAPTSNPIPIPFVQPTSKLLTRLHIQGTNIVDANGNTFHLKGVRFPIGTFPCPSSQEISGFIDKASQWGFNDIDISLDINRVGCDQDQLRLADQVISRANPRGIYVTVRIVPMRKPTQANETWLFFQPTQQQLDSYVAFWREAGKRFANNPGVAGVQLYNELAYGSTGAERAKSWSMVESYNINACRAVREASPDIICALVSVDINRWLPDTWNINAPEDLSRIFNANFPPPNSMFAFHPYNITLNSEAACRNSPTPQPQTWWCWPVNRPWENFLKRGKAVLFSEVGYFETGASIGEPYVETIDVAALRLKIAEDLQIPWMVLGPFWSTKDAKVYWLGGPTDDDAAWAKIVQPYLPHGQ